MCKHYCNCNKTKLWILTHSFLWHGIVEIASLLGDMVKHKPFLKHACSQQRGYLLPTWAQKITCQHFNWMLCAVVVMVLMTTAAFNWKVGKLFSKLKLITNNCLCSSQLRSHWNMYLAYLTISLILLHQCNGSSAVQEISNSLQAAEWLAILGGGCTADTQAALSLLQERGISMVRVE